MRCIFIIEITRLLYIDSIHISTFDTLFVKYWMCSVYLLYDIMQHQSTAYVQYSI